MAITAFLSRSPGLLNRWPGGPASLGHVPHSSIFSPTCLNFLLPGLYNNLASTLLPASVTILHSIPPLDSQGYILIFLDRMHLLFTPVHFLFWQLGRVGGQYTTQISSHRSSKQPQLKGRQSQIWQEVDSKISWQCGYGERFCPEESKNVPLKMPARTWSFTCIIAKKNNLKRDLQRYP